MHIVIVTGLSGAGKSTALRALEDIEYYCVDNLPLPFVGQVLDLMSEKGDVEHVAIAIDVRQQQYLHGFSAELAKLRAAGHKVEVLYLDCSDEVLLRRFTETRRRHPLTGDDLVDGVRRDRKLMGDLRHEAAVADTTALNVHQLKGVIQERYGRREGHLATTLLSFGFKHGLPRESNLVFDVRFLPNPYFDPELSARDGRDDKVATYVLGSDEGTELVDRLERLLRFSLPHFEREGKLYLTVAVGCTGGRHRSVAIVEELLQRLGGDWDMRVRHRDLERGG
jgi:UPF0042 nucleotide-binding protein